jgi:hypothetical protein
LTIFDVWNRVTHAGDILARAVELPGLSSTERKEISDLGPAPQ